MSISSKEIEIDKILSQDLALRHRAIAFFDYLDSLLEDQIMIDFCNVRTISRSFAQEYMTRKNHSRKAIVEINMPANVSEMFLVVDKVSEKTKLVDLNANPILLTM
jgi:hypothetical protein